MNQDIKLSDTVVAIIGLGYVGLHLLTYFARKGINVIGADNDKEKILLLKRGSLPIKVPLLINLFNIVKKEGTIKLTTNITEAAKKSNAQIICVPTPVNENKIPNLSYLVDASTDVGRGLKKGDLVIIESTVYPGVTKNIVKPILEKKSGLLAGKDFKLAYCYERVDPGNVNHRIDNTPRIIGGINKESVEAAESIYRLIVDAEIIKVSNCKVAEMAKLVENVYRDVNIALVNELAILCEKLGIDILEVLKAASSKWSFHLHIPGAGVGGSCIPVNPYYLLKVGADVNMNLKIVEISRKINENMPYHIVRLISEALDEAGKRILGTKIAILGIAYKADIDDTRNSPALLIGRKLKQLGANVVFYDPFVKYMSDASIKILANINEVIKNADCIVIATDHSLFRNLKLAEIAKLVNKPAVIVDGRHVFRPKEVKKVGLIYRGIGRTDDSDISLSDLKLR